MTDRAGVIDIGSNTIRLVLFKRNPSGRNFNEIENIKVPARLRSYIDEDYSLNQEGIQILIDALQDFKKIIHHEGIRDITCVATAAIRQAANQEDILRMVKDKTGIVISLLSGYEEAYYGYVSVIHSTNIKEGITIDVGGGSTEVTYFRDRKLIHSHSFPFGALSLKLQFVKGNIPTEQEWEQIHDYVLSQMIQLPWLREKGVPVIAMGGSARNVVQLHQRYTRYPIGGIHQYEMPVSDLRKVKEKLLPLSYPELQKTEGLSKDRADTILPAFEVFEVLCDLTKAAKFVLSIKGLREGILYQKWVNQTHEMIPLADESLQEFIKNFNVNSQDTNQITKIASVLFNQVKKINGIECSFSEEDDELLRRGAQVFHLGGIPDAESSSLTFSLLANRTLLGFSHRDRVKLALIASYKGKGTFQNYIQPFKERYTKEEQFKLCILGAILKISQSLNFSHRNIVTDLKIISKEDQWLMEIHCKEYFQSEQYHFEKQKKHLEKLVKTPIAAQFQIPKAESD
ncbi:Ppx/GppA family phosphatase [Neobacillus mesonae]|uniref:Ppx/GppA family phosphatase n=1 Tax=Neobacillus mesonae TaxID=1193713 RepID=UPI00203F64A2|nr:Ppx/GppA family phosphatase [Neobacillus mesonae]MCM3571490.1 Ppx/GppA family phosphatase [Neobacillus mesonae]